MPSNKLPASDTPVGRTMRVAAEVQRVGADEIIKASELIGFVVGRGGTLSLFERRCLDLMLRAAAGDAWKTDTLHSITKAELRQGHKSNEHIGDMLDALMSTKIRVEVSSPRGEPAILTAALLSANIEEKADDGTSLVYFRFAPEFCRIMQQSNVYAALQARAVLAFDSKYSLILYEMGCQMASRRQPTMVVTVNRLREILDIPSGAYRDWTDLRRFTLAQAKEEIDHLAHFTFHWRERRKGRKVTEVELAWWLKDDAGQRAAEEETHRHRVGRKARRRGTVEQVSE